MKSTARAAALAVASLALAATAAAAQTAPKLAYINSQQILQAAPGASDADAQIQREMDNYRTNVKRMNDSLNALVEQYNRQEVMLSPAAKEAKQKEVRDREEAYQKRKDSLEARITQRQEELLRPIQRQVQTLLDQIRTEDGYAFIFDVAANGANIVAVDRNLDITEKVIARLREQRPTAGAGTGTTPARPGGPVTQPAGVTRPRPPAER